MKIGMTERGIKASFRKKA